MLGLVRREDFEELAHLWKGHRRQGHARSLSQPPWLYYYYQFALRIYSTVGMLMNLCSGNTEEGAPNTRAAASKIYRDIVIGFSGQLQVTAVDCKKAPCLEPGGYCVCFKKNLQRSTPKDIPVAYSFLPSLACGEGTLMPAQGTSCGLRTRLEKGGGGAAAQGCDTKGR